MIIETYEHRRKSNTWHSLKYDTSKSADIAKYVARHRYAWPGGYELFAVTDDGGLLCFECCRTEFYNIAESIPCDGWHAIAIYSAVNIEGFTLCDHCGRVIHDPEG